MKTKTEAIVLHSVKYGEAKLIVDTFTRTHGRLSFVVPVSRSQKAKLKKQYFQPLTLLSVECDVRPQRQLQTMQDAVILSPYTTLLTEPSKLAIALFVAEFLYYALKGEQQDSLLFDYVRSSMEWLDQCPANYANFHLVFLMHLSRFLGFYPNLEVRGEEKEVRGEKGEVRGEYFDLREGRFCNNPPVHRDFLMPQEASRIHLMMRMNYPTMHVFRLSRADRNRTLEIIEHYYRLHLPQFPELRSLPVLRELFQ